MKMSRRYKLAALILGYGLKCDATHKKYPGTIRNKLIYRFVLYILRVSPMHIMYLAQKAAGCDTPMRELYHIVEDIMVRRKSLNV